MTYVRDLARLSCRGRITSQFAQRSKNRSNGGLGKQQVAILSKSRAQAAWGTYRELVLAAEADRHWKIETVAAIANVVAFNGAR